MLGDVSRLDRDTRDEAASCSEMRWKTQDVRCLGDLLSASSACGN